MKIRGYFKLGHDIKKVNYKETLEEPPEHALIQQRKRTMTQKYSNHIASLERKKVKNIMVSQGRDKISYLLSLPE